MGVQDALPVALVFGGGDVEQSGLAETGRFIAVDAVSCITHERNPFVHFCFRFLQTPDTAVYARKKAEWCMSLTIV